MLFLQGAPNYHWQKGLLDVVLRAAAAVAGSASVLIMLRKAEEYPIAFHEAGHSVVASHLEFCGLDARTAAGERHRGRRRPRAATRARARSASRFVLGFH